MQEEYFDVFDANGEKTGIAVRAEVHRLGLWHQTFHCWVLAYQEEKGWSVLMQLRQWDKDVFPNLLDISCAGHLQAGEKVADGVRELEEELGLAVTFERLHPCGVMAAEHLLSDTLIDREFCHVFLLREDRSCGEYAYQKSEISGLFHIPLEEFRWLITGTRGTAGVSGVQSTEAKASAMQAVRREVTVADVVPHPPQYYRFVLEEMDKFIADASGKKHR